jgi:hypothetical protein
MTMKVLLDNPQFKAKTINANPKDKFQTKANSIVAKPKAKTDRGSHLIDVGLDGRNRYVTLRQ